MMRLNQGEIIRDLRESAFKMLRTANEMEQQLGDSLVERMGRCKLDAATNVAIAEIMYAERRRRVEFLDSDLIGEPVWDILLDLYIRSKQNKSTTITSSCLASSVPMTTALRYLRELEQRGYVVTEESERDKRSRNVRLSQEFAQKLDQYFAKSKLPEQMTAIFDPPPPRRVRSIG